MNLKNMVYLIHKYIGGIDMNLFIIGNGFDLAHNLPTQYINFREYLDEHDWRFLMRLEEIYGFYSGSNIELLEKYLWQNFESNLSDINETEIIEFGSNIELGLEGGDFGVEETLDSHWEDQYGYIKKLNDYLNLWIQQIDIDVNKKTSFINEQNNDLFITFNYTLLLEEIYNIDSYDILHIHGSINPHDTPPIIGHGDYCKIEEMESKALEYSDKNMEKETSIYNAVRHYYERTFKDVEHYIKWNDFFFDRLKGIEQVFIIGHSFGDVDLPYFKEVFRSISRNAQWNVYFYDPNDELIFKNKLISIGINEANIKTYPTDVFYNM